MTRGALAQSPASLSFVFRGKTYHGKAGDRSYAREFRAEGARPGYKLTFMGVLADFAGVLPAAGDLLPVTHADGRTERLKVANESGVVVDAAGGMVSINLIDARG